MAEVLRYPKELISDTTDYLEIQIYKYSSGSLTTSGTVPGSLTDSIYLPIPSNIQDGNSVSYADDSLDTLTAEGLQRVGKVMQEGTIDLNNISGSVGNIANLMTNEAKGFFKSRGPEVSNLVLKGLAAQAVSIFGGNVSLNSYLAREEGKILNPNMELLFNGVTLRNFRFSFKLTPRDDVEGKELKKIIRALKKNMAAKGNVGNNARNEVFLETPNVFRLQYKKGKDPHPFLHAFKPCFLKDMSVNYTGENIYAVYSDGVPVSMTMDLSFQEMFPIYADDYKEFEDDDIKKGVGY